MKNCVHMNNTRNIDWEKKLLGFIGYKFPYLQISVMIQSASLTYTIYEVLFLSTELDGILIG